jgi:hypothetical protein
MELEEEGLLDEEDILQEGIHQEGPAVPEGDKYSIKFYILMVL